MEPLGRPGPIRPRLNRPRGGEGGITPVQLAALRKRESTANALLAQGLPLDFFSAVALGRVAEVGAWLQQDPSLANAVLEAERTSALAIAVAHGHAKVVRLLVGKGADPNGTNRWTSCLHAAVDHLPDPDLVTLLIVGGAKVDAADGDGNTPPNIAARRGNVELARLLDTGRRKAAHRSFLTFPLTTFGRCS